MSEFQPIDVFREQELIRLRRQEEVKAHAAEAAPVAAKVIEAEKEVQAANAPVEPTEEPKPAKKAAAKRAAAPKPDPEPKPEVENTTDSEPEEENNSEDS